MHPDRLDALTRRLGEATSRRGLLGLLGGGVVGTAMAAVSLSETRAKSNHKKNKSKRDKGNNGGNHRNDSKNAGSIQRLTNIPITAHDQQGHNFEGVLNISRFAEEGGQLVAHGTVSGKVTGRGVGNQPASQDVVIPVSFQASGASVHAQATCNILDLFLGPIDLDLLGLVLHVNQIHIHLTANPAGGLLGQLLCGIANLLNTGGLLSDIADLLNQILANL